MRKNVSFFGWSVVACGQIVGMKSLLGASVPFGAESDFWPTVLSRGSMVIKNLILVRTIITARCERISAQYKWKKTTVLLVDAISMREFSQLIHLRSSKWRQTCIQNKWEEKKTVINCGNLWNNRCIISKCHNLWPIEAVLVFELFHVMNVEVDS